MKRGGNFLKSRSSKVTRGQQPNRWGQARVGTHSRFPFLREIEDPVGGGGRGRTTTGNGGGPGQPGSPTASFTWANDPSDPSGKTVCFTSTSFGPNGEPTSELTHAWSFGPSTDPSTCHTFSECGTFTVALSVSTAAGANSTTTRDVTTDCAGGNNRPTVSATAEYTVESDCDTATWTLRPGDLTTDSSGTPWTSTTSLSYTWTVEGDTYTTAEATHTSTADSITVTLEATDSATATSTEITAVFDREPPPALPNVTVTKDTGASAEPEDFLMTYTPPVNNMTNPTGYSRIRFYVLEDTTESRQGGDTTGDNVQFTFNGNPAVDFIELLPLPPKILLTDPVTVSFKVPASPPGGAEKTWTFHATAKSQRGTCASSFRNDELNIEKTGTYTNNVFTVEGETVDPPDPIPVEPVPVPTSCPDFWSVEMAGPPVQKIIVNETSGQPPVTSMEIPLRFNYGGQTNSEMVNNDRGLSFDVTVQRQGETPVDHQNFQTSPIRPGGEGGFLPRFDNSQGKLTYPALVLRGTDYPGIHVETDGIRITYDMKNELGESCGEPWVFTTNPDDYVVELIDATTPTEQPTPGTCSRMTEITSFDPSVQTTTDTRIYTFQDKSSGIIEQFDTTGTVQDVTVEVTYQFYVSDGPATTGDIYDDPIGNATPLQFSVEDPVGSGTFGPFPVSAYNVPRGGSFTARFVEDIFNPDAAAGDTVLQDPSKYLRVKMQAKRAGLTSTPDVLRDCGSPTYAVVIKEDGNASGVIKQPVDANLTYQVYETTSRFSVSMQAIASFSPNPITNVRFTLTDVVDLFNVDGGVWKASPAAAQALLDAFLADGDRINLPAGEALGFDLVAEGTMAEVGTLTGVTGKAPQFFKGRNAAAKIQLRITDSEGRVGLDPPGSAGPVQFPTAPP